MMRWTPWQQASFDSIKAFSETDFTEDLKKFDKPTSIVHGDDDQIVPIDAAARASVRLVPHATLKVYAGAPHGLADTQGAAQRRSVSVPEVIVRQSCGISTR